jgi:capsid protein
MFERITAAAKVLFRGASALEKPAIISERKKIYKNINKIVRKKLQAHYDSAQTTDENKRHWVEARDNTPITANNRDTRRRLRIRAQYEHDNNCYCSGVVSTLSKDTIGAVAPHLQVTTDNREFNSFVESEWQKWASYKAVNLTHKLKLLDTTKIIQGEGFFLFQSDEETKRCTNYGLNPQVLSANRVADPAAWHGMYQGEGKIFNDDGVLIDLSHGRPAGYVVTDITSEVYGSVNIFNRGHFISPQYLHQWYIPTRPHQYRGVCEIQAALNKFGQIRRYSAATLGAAEFAACLVGVMKTNLPAENGPAVVKDYTLVELVRNMLISLPEGWEASQFEPKQPIAGYGDFIDRELREVGRLLDVPRGVMLGDSSAYNYSSARMDYQGYDDRIAYLRNQLIIIILDPLFNEWFTEFILYNLSNPDSKIRALIRSNIAYDYTGKFILPTHNWQFTKRQSIDPEKDANAAKTRMQTLTSTLAIECANLGYDWEELLESYKKIMERISELGLTNVFDSAIIGVSVASTAPASTTNTQPANGNPNVNGNGKLKV